MEVDLEEENTEDLAEVVMVEDLADKEDGDGDGNEEQQ